MSQALTPQERQKIYEIERERVIARNRLQQEATQELLQSKVSPGLILFAVIVIVVGILFVRAMYS